MIKRIKYIIGNIVKLISFLSICLIIGILTMLLIAPLIWLFTGYSIVNKLNILLDNMIFNEYWYDKWIKDYEKLK